MARTATRKKTALAKAQKAACQVVGSCQVVAQSQVLHAGIAKLERDAPGSTASDGRAILRVIDAICNPTGAKLARLEEKPLQRPSMVAIKPSAISCL